MLNYYYKSKKKKKKAGISHTIFHLKTLLGWWGKKEKEKRTWLSYCPPIFLGKQKEDEKV